DKYGLRAPAWHIGDVKDDTERFVPVTDIYNKSFWNMQTHRHPTKTNLDIRFFYERPVGHALVGHIAYGNVFLETAPDCSQQLTNIANDLGLDIASVLLFRTPGSNELTLASIEPFYDRKHLPKSYERDFTRTIAQGTADKKG